MQILKCEVTPVELKLRQPARLAGIPEISHITAIFVRIETKDGRNAYGCTVAHPDLTGERPEQVRRTCLECADLVPDLHPINIEYSLAKISAAANQGARMAAVTELQLAGFRIKQNTKNRNEHAHLVIG